MSERWLKWVPRPAKVLRLRNIRRALFWTLALFMLLDLSFPLPAEKPYAQLLFAADGSLMHARLSPDDKWRLPVQLEEIPEEVTEALIAKEDRYFWYHPGVNPFAVMRAAFGNVISGKRSSGASTITMQVARLMEPKARTLGSKIWEAFRAFQLEWHLSKPQILEMYLNYLPYGGNVEGVKAASLIYFGKAPQELSASQVTLLAAIPNRPNSLRPDRQSENAKAARDKWLKRLEQEGKLSALQVASALTEPVPDERRPLPKMVPQLSHRLLQGKMALETHSTLRPAIQSNAAVLLANHVNRKQDEGITNGALLVVDNRSMEVVAYCGSADFSNKENKGEVDGISAVRSPGSTLKPLLYALAFDQGKLSSKQHLLDIPSDYSGFAPVNYDRNFRGSVPADDALRQSLNLPAIRLLSEVGMSKFLNLLARGGFHTITQKRKELGLSLALGGCGATLEELVQAYAAIANGGRWQPLRYRADAPVFQDELRICSPAAAYIVSQILSGMERPDLPAEFLSKSKLPKLAWKTGTSFGRRDAWAIGFNPRWTVGVWMGNMDGSSILNLSGSKTAVPLLMEMFTVLDHDGRKDWFKPVPEVMNRKVCAQSGLLPSHFCNHLVDDLAIRGITPAKRCQHAIEVLVDVHLGIQYCKACVPTQGYTKALYPNYPPVLSLWMQRNNIAYLQPPQHNPDCHAIFADAGPSIYSPAQRSKYLLEEGKQILLQAAPSPDASQHFWYANNEFLGKVKAGEQLFFAAKDGHYAITCLDDKGRKSTVSMEVEIF